MKHVLIAAMLLSRPPAFSAAPAPAIKIALVGDSTVNDQGGWGPGFRAFFTAGVDVTNYAMNGRSSKSFRDEGRWIRCLPPIRPTS